MTQGHRIPGYSSTPSGSCLPIPSLSNPSTPSGSNLVFPPTLQSEESQCLAKLAAHLPGLVFQFRLFPDGTSCLPYVSAGIQNVFRLTPDDVQADGTRMFERMHPDDLPQINTAVRTSAVNLSLFHEQYRLRFDNGEVTWVEGRAQPERLEDGSILWHGFITDITRQKKMEEAIRQRETLFRKMADASPVFTWMMGADGQMEYLNKTLLSFAARDLKDMLGTGWRLIVHPDDAGPAYAKLMDCMAARAPFEFTLRNLRADGLFRTVQHWASPWFHDDGSLGGYIGSGIDITDQKLAQDEVVRMRDQLDSILTSLPEVVFSVSMDLQNCYFMGSAAEAVYGRPASEFIADPKLWVNVIHSNDVYKLESAMEDLRTYGRSCLEYRIIRPDGTHAWVSATSRVIRDSTGYPLRIDGIVADITSRIKAEADLRKARDAAEAASRHKSEFLASMSHEIRTPMTAIVGYAHLLTSGRTTPEDRTLWNVNIKQNSDYLLNLVNDILDLSKIEAGQIDLHPQQINPWALTQEIVSLMGPRAMEKMLALDVSRFGDTPREVIADGTRLRQILVNLVTNAIKFTDKGNIGIEMSSEKVPGTDRTALVFVISDTGMGIDPDKVDRLFKPFSRIADNSPGAVRPGTGLGLVIAMKFARKMGGDITLESVPGQGSRFTVKIDAGPTAALDFLPDTHETLPVPQSPASSPIDNALSGVRVLVTDDNPDNLRIIQFILEQAGAIVDLAANGCEATEKILNRHVPSKIDIILMDMQMPVCDGYTATRILRGQGKTIPIIALTAFTMAGDKQKCLDAGCTSYLTKPVVPDALIKELLMHLDPAKTAALSNTTPPRGTNPNTCGMLANPRFAKLVEEYAQSLKETRKNILLHIADADHPALRVLAHKLKGSGTNYGFPEITRTAALCESAIKSELPLAEINNAANTLIRQIDAALSTVVRPTPLS
jgi:PAS domain S-box-containing protein